MAELADAPDSKSGVRKGVWVRLPPYRPNAGKVTRRHVSLPSCTGRVRSPLPAPLSGVTLSTAEYHRNWYHKNKDRIRIKKRQQRVAYLRKLRAVLNEAKSKPCADCGQNYPPYVMDFDHKGNKEFVISDSLFKGISKLEQEMAKCDVVCANCHRERTFGGLGKR